MFNILKKVYNWTKKTSEAIVRGIKDIIMGVVEVSKESEKMKCNMILDIIRLIEKLIRDFVTGTLNIVIESGRCIVNISRKTCNSKKACFVITGLGGVLLISNYLFKTEGE